MALISWEPVPARLVTSLFDTPTTGAPATRRFAPAMDVVETETHYVLRADLPGVADADVTVELDGNVLSISGERRMPQASPPAGYARLERSAGAFRRTVRLPEGVEASAIEASLDRGVLEVTVPKPVAATPQRIAIGVGAAAPVIEGAATATSEDAE